MSKIPASTNRRPYSRSRPRSTQLARTILSRRTSRSRSWRAASTATGLARNGIRGRRGCGAGGALIALATIRTSSSGIVGVAGRQHLELRRAAMSDQRPARPAPPHETPAPRRPACQGALPARRADAATFGSRCAATTNRCTASTDRALTSSGPAWRGGVAPAQAAQQHVERGAQHERRRGQHPTVHNMIARQQDQARAGADRRAG